MYNIAQILATFRDEGELKLGFAENERRCYSMLLVSIPLIIVCYILVLVTELSQERSSIRLGIQLILPLSLLLLCLLSHWLQILKRYSGFLMIIAISIVLGEQAIADSNYLSELYIISAPTLCIVSFWAKLLASTIPSPLAN